MLNFFMNRFFRNRELNSSLYIFLYVIIIYLSSELPFFWDNVLLSSRYAQHFYENGYSTLILPSALDAGHPPFYGLYLAIVWKIFGKSLVSSHWAIFPFVVGIVFAFSGICKKVIGNTSFLIFVLFILVAEPSLLSQIAFAGIDIALLSITLLCVYSLFSGKVKWLYFLLPILSMLSLRGIIFSIGIGFCHFLLFNSNRFGVKRAASVLPFYLPVITLLMVWFSYHFYHTGFVTDNYMNNNWSEQYRMVTFKEFGKNMLVVVWRMVDQGRIFIWIPLFVFLGRVFIKKTTITKEQYLLWGTICILFFLLLPFLVFRNTPILHRYFLIIYLLSGILLFSYVSDIKSRILKTTLTASVFAGLLSGHLWIYPFPIANGWDSTLAALPYFKAKEQVNNFIEQSSISPDRVTSAFPMLAGKKYTHLNEFNGFQFINKSKRAVKNSEFVLYSNVSNDFTLFEKEMLSKDFIKIKSFDSKPVVLELYQHKN